jgi:hypothetical protein
MASRTRPRKPAKKAAAKKAVANSNSKVADTLAAQADNERKKQQAANAKKNNPKLEPRTSTPMANSGRGTDPEQIAQRDIGTAASKAANETAKRLAAAMQGRTLGTPNPYTATPQPGDASKPTGLLAGLTTGIGSMQGEVKGQAASKPKYEAANPSLYGHSTAQSAANLADRITAVNATIQQQKQKGNAVYMGMDPNAPLVKIRRSGPERMDEFGGTTEEQKAQELILTKDQLLGWLADDQKVAQIKAAAEKAGFTVGSYDDVSKLWTAVVSQAASAYSINSQKVTPWALISLRGKYLVNGRPADRVTTSTSIDEMTPEEARLMAEDSATKLLGRAPTKQELDDFIAKAQTISKQNPAVTKTTHHYDITGNEESQTNVTTGGQQAASAKQQVALEDQMKQSEDYAAFQAAGNYFPMLFDALRSPV